MFLSTAPMPLPMVAGDGAASYGCVAWRAAARAAGAAHASSAGGSPFGHRRPGARRCEAFRATAATRRRTLGEQRLPGSTQACGQSTALIWFGFGLLACLASVREVIQTRFYLQNGLPDHAGRLHTLDESSTPTDKSGQTSSFRPEDDHRAEDRGRRRRVPV